MQLRAFALSALVLACGPDHEPELCHANADFEVVLRAAEGPLPSDLKLELHYGGRAYDDPETLVVAEPKAPPQALFCYVADRDGAHPAGEAALGAPGASDGTAGAAGAAGAGSEGEGVLQGLFCRLWTDGSADLDVSSERYRTTTVHLQTQNHVCTVEKTIELTLPDAGE